MNKQMKYVVNADDFGMDENTSKAIVKAFNDNRINRTSIMVNMDYFEESYIESIRKGFFTAVGLHLNLTKGMPLTEKIKEFDLFCGHDGCFNGISMMNNKNRLLPFSKDLRIAVSEEIDAQFRKYLDYYGGKGTYHLDSHHHIHKNLNILPICLDISKKYGFKAIRFAKTSGSFANCCYNNVVNHYIVNNSEYKYYKLFDSVNDYNIRKCGLKESDRFEIECHPIEREGILYDGGLPLPILEYYGKNK